MVGTTIALVVLMFLFFERTIIGKALGSLSDGTGVISMLIMLR